jgi:L-fuconolactonase
VQLLERHPDLPVVVDHGAKPRIRDREFERWAADVSRLASETRCHCKLSGLATEADEDWTDGDLRPYVDHLFTAFGPSRILWGSDWPVVELAGGFERWQAASLRLLQGLDEASRADVLGENARRFYGLSSAEETR